MSPGFRTRLEVVFNSEYHLLTSAELFRDMARGIQKPKVAERITRLDYEKLVSKLHLYTELVVVRSVVDACRDPKDNFLLALAKDGNADYLITGDLDLLTMEAFEKTKIVSLTGFEHTYEPRA